MADLFRFGIEEELFLADAGTRDTPQPQAAERFHAAVQATEVDVERELLLSQVEIVTPPAADAAEARASLAGLRGRLASVARDHGLRVLAAGTHPMARWKAQRATPKARYAALTRELRMIARRDVVCGMHVHVEVPDPGTRVDLMNRLMPFTPLLLALSASSPFWQGRPTGLASYRVAVWNAMPRTGLPELFADAADYARLVSTLQAVGAIKDASYLWWLLRPASRYPTLELRVADSCPRLEDTLAIASLYRCLVRLAVRRPELNRGLTGASRAIVAENLWRAQRDGVRAELIDEASATAEPMSRALARLLGLVEEDVAALGCQAEVEHARVIVADGTAADRQVAVHAAARTAGRSRTESMAAVVDWLADATDGAA